MILIIIKLANYILGIEYLYCNGILKISHNLDIINTFITKNNKNFKINLICREFYIL
jgi:hypothetical protein